MARKKKNQTKQWSVQLTDKLTDMVIMQLVNIEFYPKLSDETLAFNADLRVIVGAESFIAECKNNGQGGCTDIDVYDNDTEAMRRHIKIIRSIDDWYKTQDDTGVIEYFKKMGLTLNHTPKMSLENKVDSMIAEWCDDNGL